MITKTKEQEAIPKTACENNERLPDEVIRAMGFDQEYDRVEADIKATEALTSALSEKFDRDIMDADLMGDSRGVADLALTKTKIDLTKLRAKRSRKLLEENAPRLQETTAAAADRVRQACWEASRGHQELMARQIEKHFASISDARSAAETAPKVEEWMKKAQSIPQYAVYQKLPHIVELARDAFPEIERLKKELPGGIPSIVEMNS